MNRHCNNRPRDIVRLHPTPLVLAVAAALQSAGMARAAEIELPRIDIVGGGAEAVKKIPGTVNIVTREDLERLQPLSTEAALKNVPGVAIKPEEETAIVANIGMRGLSAGEYKTLIMEDGVPVAPDLFFGNSRYYNPRIQRMEGIEVLKGAASLRYGPSTIGGVINYKTRTPEEGVAVSARIGSHNYRETTVEAGGKAASGDANAGLWLTRAQGDGFLGKGFDMTDLMLKSGMAVGDNQWVGVKLTHYESEANISYRGHFLDAYRAGAGFNPAPDDWLLVDRNSLDINHEWDIDDRMKLSTVAYWSEMNRDYWRFGLVGGTPTQTAGGVTRWNYGNTLDGNNRAFERVGIDSRLAIDHDSFGIKNETGIGVRLMRESMSDKRIPATRANPRTASGAPATDIGQKATSVALFAQNRFVIGDRFAVTPGLRIERYKQETDNLKDDTKDGQSSNTEVLPGVGLTWQLSPAAQLYGGVYEAFSPPYNSTSIVNGVDLKLDAERSTNYEIGLRGASGPLRYEVTAFRMAFGNQIVRANSNGGDPSNAGKTLHQGLEVALGYAWGNGFDVAGNVTWVPDAKFVGNRFNQNGTLSAADGKRVTYSPERVANLTLGYTSGPLKTALSLNRVGAQFTDAANTVPIAENTTGFFTGRIDAYTTLDLTASYAIGKKLDIFGAVKNLADERYVASLRQGIYAGPERSFELGAKYRF